MLEVVDEPVLDPLPDDDESLPDEDELAEEPDDEDSDDEDSLLVEVEVVEEDLPRLSVL